MDSQEAFITQNLAEVVKGRKIGDYALGMGFNPELLRGQTVLNFGCGGSNLGRDLERKNINADIVELDVRFNPSTSIIAPVIEKVQKHIRPYSTLYGKLDRIRQDMSGITNRNFVQADGKALPFSDETFDTVIAYHSTYQVPEYAKEEVFRELLRVGKALFCGPIFKDDFERLSKLALEQNCEIVACHPLPFFNNKNFIFKSTEDYNNYINSQVYNQRIQKPKFAKPIHIPILEENINLGHYIVLRRKS